MKKSTLMISAAVFALTAGSAFAQDATPAPAADTATPAPAAAPAADAATPAPVAAPEAPAAEGVAQPSSETETAPAGRNVGTFGAWSVMCVDPVAEQTDASQEPAVKSCIARQQVSLSEEEGGPVMNIFLEKSPKNGSLMMSVATPVGVAIQPGVSLMLNESDTARVWYAPFDSCTTDACVAMGSVNEDVFLQAKSPAIAFSLADYQLIGVKFVAEGAAEAINALDLEVMPAAEEAAPAEAPAAPAASPEAAPAEAPAPVAPAN